jgi:lysozyme
MLAFTTHTSIISTVKEVPLTKDQPVPVKDTKYFGIDISKYQRDVMWEKLDSSISFVICKASEGVTLVDYKFKKNWESIRCKKGAYHFFLPQCSGKKQADLYLSVVNLECGDILPIIDVEHVWAWDKLNRKKSVDNLLEMVDVIEKKLGVTPIIYTSARFWDKYICPYYNCTNHNNIIWVADYRNQSDPETPKHYKEWVVWQYSCRGHLSGINGFVDLNLCKNLDTLLIR